MDTSGSAITDIIQRYCETLELMGIRVEQVLLFGSHAREGADEDSDIDLLIVSPDFVTLDRLDRQRVLSRARLCVEAPVHAYPATPSEVTAVEPATFLQEVLETGLSVAFAPAGRTRL